MREHTRGKTNGGLEQLQSEYSVPGQIQLPGQASPRERKGAAERLRSWRGGGNNSAPEGTKCATSVNVRLPCLRRDLRTGSISRDVNFPSELCRRRSGIFTDVARLVPPGMCQHPFPSLLPSPSLPAVIIIVAIMRVNITAIIIIIIILMFMIPRCLEIWDKII